MATGNPALRVQSLGKRYQLGASQASVRDLREAIARAATAPLRWTHLWQGRPRSEREYLWALRDISFTVAPGEVVGVIGRNGAGKSTLLKILSRITDPTEGRAEVRGRISSLLEVGTGFHPELTGRENLFLNGAVLGMSRGEIRRKFDEIVAFAEIEPFLDTPIKHYSSGMKVRLAFSVAAHLEPEILLVDEVLAVGDVNFQRKCLGKMDQVARGGRTVLLVSHNMTAVENLCPRSILLHRGAVVEDGPTGGVIDRYLRLNRGDDGGDEGRWDLSDRRNPCLDAPPIITGVRLLDAAGRDGTTFRMGEPMTVEVEVDGLSRYRGSQLGITVRSIHGQALCGINTGMACRYGGGGRADCEVARLEIPRLPFTPNQYWLEVQAAQKGVRMIDLVPEAVRFEVVEADVYGSGYQVSSYFGVVYLDAEWTLEARTLAAPVSGAAS